MSLIKELKRRNVIRIGIAYTVASWVLLQVIDVVGGIIDLPAWLPRGVLLSLVIGFIPVLLLAWAFELTPEGVKRETSAGEHDRPPTRGMRRLDRVIIVLLLLALGYFVYESRFRPPHPGDREAAANPSARTVAVLPFVNLSSDSDQDYFADGLTEEILNALSRLPELKVTGRTSAFHFKGRDLPIVEIATTLGVDHVVEGSVRRAGETLRVTAELVRAADGFRLWSEVYDGRADQVFEVQEDVAENIARALDVYLDEKKRITMFAAGTRSIPAWEAFLKGRELYDRGHRVFSPADRWQANALLEQASRLDPQFSAAYSLHHDALAHFLMQDMPADDPGLTETQALARIRQDYANALRTARDPRLRLATQLSGALFNDSWRNVPEAVAELERFVEAGQVEIRGPGWSHMLLVAIGRARLGLLRAQNEIRHDPLDPLSFANAAGAALGLGEFDAALDYVRQGYLLSPGHTFLVRSEAMALILKGQLEAGARSLQSIGGQGFHRMLAIALDGDRTQALSLARASEQSRPRDGSPLWVYAELGASEDLTRMTRSIDAAPAGSLSFLRLIYYSGGYAPFDMDAAPNFRRRLREAGGDPDRLPPWVPLSKPGESP